MVRKKRQEEQKQTYHSAPLPPPSSTTTLQTSRTEEKVFHEITSKQDFNLYDAISELETKELTEDERSHVYRKLLRHSRDMCKDGTM